MMEVFVEQPLALPESANYVIECVLLLTYCASFFKHYSL